MPGEILSRKRVRRVADLFGRALRDDLPAMLPCTRPHVDDVIRRQDRIGTLEVGKLADLAVFDVADYREIPYYFGVNHCVMTIKRGEIVYSRDGIEPEQFPRGS